MNPLRALVIAGSLGAVLTGGDRTAEKASVPPRQPAVLASRPLVFEANRGQTDASVKFLARGGRCTAFLTPTETVLPVRGGALRIRPAGANPSAEVEGVDELPGKANYFLGNDASKWRTGVPTFARVRSRGVYPGIDVVSYGTEGRLEYDFVVAPGADPSVIAIEFAGADDVQIDEHGDVVARAGGTEFRQPVPVVYEETDGVRRTIEGRYVMDGADRVRFAVAGRDPSRTLFIDPVVYATYLGGNDPSGGLERILGMARDAQGNTYVSGGTTSADFPLAGPLQATYAGAGGVTRGDVFVTKIDPTGHTILYSTYVGGTADEEGNGIAVDGVGSAFVVGESRSSDFPTTPGSLQPAFGGYQDGFVAKLNPAGSGLVYSTYYGAGSAEVLYGIELGSLGEAFVIGASNGGVATTTGTFQPNFGGGSEDGLLAKLTPAGDALVYSTYIGGSGFERGTGIAVTASGEACVTGYTNSTDFPTFLAVFQSSFGGGGYDGFVARVNASGTALVFSTLLGGSGDDYPSNPSLDGLGNLYVPGYTTSADFPTRLPIQPAFAGGGGDAFLTKFAAGGDVSWSTYLGGSGDDAGYATATTPGGVTWMAGYTKSADFPIVHAANTALSGGTDAFLAKVDAAGTAFDEVTYVGGSGDDYGFALVLDASGNPLVGGQTSSTDLPTSSGAFQTAFGGGSNDAFLSTTPAPPSIASFFLPKKVTAKVNAKNVAKSTLVAVGVYDTGPNAANLASAATLDVGGLHVPIPGLTLKGKAFTFAGNGFTFSILPNAFGSSRATFKLKFTGDLTNMVSLGGPLALRFANAVADGGATVSLTAGKFSLGKIKGSLVAPNLFLAKARANFKGAGKDTLSMIVGLAAGGTTPPAASELTIGFGGGVAATIPVTSFVRKGNSDVFIGNINGITKVTVDYARDQISITGKGLNLGNYAQGGNSVLISVALGSEQHAVRVRMGRIGNAMKY